MTSTRRARHEAWLLGALLTITVLSGCFQHAESPDQFRDVPPGRWSTTASSSPELLQTLGDPSTSGLAAWPGQFDNTPIAYDFNQDGVDEVVAHSTDRHVYVFDSTTGRALAKLSTTYPPAWYAERVLNGVQAGVLIPGQPPSLVITNHAAYVSVWTFDPNLSTQTDFVFNKDWEKRMDDCYPSPGMDAAAALGDLDGDGTLEIVVQTEEIGFFALDADGSTRWGYCWSGGNSAPVIDDLDGDGRPEVMVASDAGRLSVHDGDTGHALWSFAADDAAYGITPASVPVSPTVAELDGHPPKEVLFTARHAPEESDLDFTSFHMAIFAVRQNLTTWQGELVWMRQPDWANPLSNTKLVVNDVDGDGLVDIVGMDWNTIGHRPGDWERLGPANVFRLDAQGQDVWVREVDAWWSNQDILVADSDGDGETDILVNGPGDSGDGMWRLSTETGSAQGFLATAPWKMLRGPGLADLHDDGSMHLIVPVTPMDGDQQRGAILVYRLDSSADAAQGSVQTHVPGNVSLD